MRFLFIALLFFAADLRAAQELTGQTATGAFYTINAPDDWTPSDGLVIYNHGFDLGSIEVEPNLGVLGGYLLDQGFAVAASSYSLNGWALFQTTEDNRQMFDAFVERFGNPERVLVLGGSLGALVTVQAVERGGIGNVVGAYALCGPLAGSDVWRTAFDLRLIYDVVCEGTNGELPGGANGLPFALDPGDLDGILGELTAATLGARVLACTGLEIPDALRSDDQRQRLARLIELTGISEAFLPINLGYATVGMSDLVYDPRKLNQGAALGNANVDYGDEEINARILRVERDPFDELAFRRAYTPTGRVGSARILMTHTDKDDLVVPEHQAAYLEKLDPARVVAATVIDDEPGHCQYSEAEVVAGWETLLRWIESDQQPDAQAIQDQCATIVADGRFDGPCRYDPTYEAAPIATRIRPRNEPEQPVDGSLSGSFFTRSRDGQGWFIEVLPEGRSVVYWFTYDDSGAPVWIGGTGEILGNAIVVDESWRGTGARFGMAFDPADVILEPWGSLQFIFTGDGAGEMAWAGPAHFGSGHVGFEQLTRIGSASCGAAAPELSGLWFDPTRNGEGFIIEAQADDRFFAAWFTYDPDGNQLWLYGEGDRGADGTVSFALSRFSGPVFGEDYDADRLQAESWGVLEVTPSASGLIAAYFSSLAGFGNGELALTRLTHPEAAGCESAP